MQHIWTENEKEYLKEIVEGKSYKEILFLMNEKFEYEFRLNQIIGAMRRYNLNTGRTGQFEKGSAPWNKGLVGVCKPNSGTFKKGNVPGNKKEVGQERVNVEGYIGVKVGEPSEWEYKHNVVWREKYGPIPKGGVVIFGDRDRSNINIDNLILVDRKQLLVMNRNGLIKDDLELTKVGLNVAKLMIKMSEAKK